MDYFQLSQSIGIDTIINKKLLTANTIFRYVRKGDVVDMKTLNNLNVEILEFVVNPNSKVANYKIKDINANAWDDTEARHVFFAAIARMTRRSI